MLATTLIFFQFVWNPNRLVLEEYAFRYQVCADMEGHVSVFDPTDWRCHYVDYELFKALPHEYFHERMDRKEKR